MMLTLDVLGLQLADVESYLQRPFGVFWLDSLRACVYCGKCLLGWTMSNVTLPEHAMTEAYASTFPVRDPARLRAILAPIRVALREGWSLSESALFGCIAHLEGRTQAPRIVEFGSGLSTRVFSDYFDGHCEITSIEHDASFAEDLRTSLVGRASTRVLHRPLIRLSDSEFEGFFSGAQPIRHLPLAGEELPAASNADYRLRNTFYRLSDADLTLLAGADLVVVDGPHGNGRSLAFPLIARFTERPCLVLVDDANHYDFLWRAGKSFRWLPLCGEFHPRKRWMLIEKLGPDSVSR